MKQFILSMFLLFSFSQNSQAVETPARNITNTYPSPANCLTSADTNVQQTINDIDTCLGRSGAPGSPNTSFQYNNSGVFAGGNMYQDSNGNIGIGTTIPGTLFSVGSLHNGSSTTKNAFNIDTNGNITNLGGGILNFNAAGLNGTNSGQPYAFGNASSSPNSSVNIYTGSSSGKITLSPASNTVTATVSSSGVQMNGFQLGSSATSGQVLTADSSGNGTWQNSTANIGGGTQAIITASNGIKLNPTGSKDVMVLTGSNNFGIGSYFPQGGNVGIGTGNPQELLDVAASVKTGIGSQTNPGLIVGTDTTTGIFNPVDITHGWAVSTNGTERMRLDGNGNLGIGSTAPGALVDVGGTVRIFNGNVGISVTSPGKRLDVNGTARVVGFTMSGSNPQANYVLTSTDSSGDATWQVAGNASQWTTQNTTDVSLASGNVGIGTTKTTTAALTVMNGNVGIGTWVPSYSLQVNGTGYFNGGITAFGIGALNSFVWWNSGARLYGNSGDGWINLTNSGGTGGVLFGTPATATFQLGAIDAASPVAQNFQVQSVNTGTSNTAGTNFAINGSKGTGTGVGGSILLQTAPAGTTGTTQNALMTALAITGAGNVGIGTTTPAGGLAVMNGNVGIGTWVPGLLLDVKGTSRMTGFNLNSGASLNGKVLTSDANGNGTWTTAANSSQWATQNTTDVSLAGGNVGIGTTLTSTSALTVMNGNVGIGTWIPNSIFQVAGQGILTVSNNIGIGTSFSTNNLDVAGNVAIGKTYAGYFNAPTNGLIVAGNVGIGSTIPGFVLDVQGTTRFTGDILAHGAGPTCSSCGTCSVIGNDNWFRVTVGSTTSCTATFSVAKTQNSGCVCSQEGTATFPTCSVSTTSVTCSTVVTGDALDCTCGG